MVKVKLLKPLNGQPIGAEASFSEADAKHLETKNAVEIVKEKPAPKPDSKSKAKD